MAFKPGKKHWKCWMCPDLLGGPYEARGDALELCRFFEANKHSRMHKSTCGNCKGPVEFVRVGKEQE